MATPPTRQLLLQQARVQLRLACRDAEDAVTGLETALGRLAELLSRPGVLGEQEKDEALAILMQAWPLLQFHDRQRQRLEHLDLALALAAEPHPGRKALDTLEQAFTLPEERDALNRLRQGESWRQVAEDPWHEEGPSSELF